MPGTESGYHPFWKPDSRSIGFFTETSLKRIDISSGTVQTIADSLGGNGCAAGTWHPDGSILMSGCGGPLYQIPAARGAPVDITQLKPQQVSHRFPYFLPDGHSFLFYVLGTPNVRGVYAGSLHSKDSRRLFESDSAAVFSPPNYVLFARQGALFALRLDLEKLVPIGDPFPVAPQIAVNATVAGDVALSSSVAGTVVYRSGGAKRQFVWFERSGKQTPFGEPDTAEPVNATLSPNGRYIALNRTIGGNSDIWLIEVPRGILERVTTDAEYDGVPVWSPDSTTLVFSSRQRGRRELFKVHPSTKQQDLFLDAGSPPDAEDWSSDSRYLLYTLYTDETAADLWCLPLFGERKPFSVAQTPFEEVSARFSSDGHWIAFQSNETGRNEIYIQPFPGPGKRVPVSSSGGTSPYWGEDMHELFYVAPDGRLMATPVNLQAKSQEMNVGAPVALFTVRGGSQYVPSPDGQRFLINTLTEDAAPINVILNWAPEGQ